MASEDSFRLLIAVQLVNLDADKSVQLGQLTIDIEIADEGVH